MPKMLKTKTFINKNQKGQVLLLVIVTMTIALALGVGVSLQTLSSLSDVADTDTASRSLAAAEGGAERFLALSATDLDAWAQGNNRQSICENVNGTYDSSTSECIINFDPSSNDNITAQAYVSVDYFSSTSSSASEYAFTLVEGSVKEINLNGISNDVNLCWNDNGASDLYYTAYSDTGVVSRNFVECSSGSCSGYGLSGALSANSGGGSGYSSCITLPYDDSNNGVPQNVVGLRVRSLNQNAEASVSLQGGASLPTQGYEITSKGSLQEDTQIIIQKTVVVYRAYSYMPGIFDFALYSEGGLSGGN